MKIKSNKKIQRLVDELKGSAITRLTALHTTAASYTDEIGTVSEACSDAATTGVFQGIRLAEKYLKAKGRFIEVSGDVPTNFGIYFATQETGDGTDCLYFIGTPDQIIKKLEKVKA